MGEDSADAVRVTFLPRQGDFMSGSRSSRGGAMYRAIELAGMAGYRTAPNPMVGAVVVRDGDVVGEGFHQRAGGPHAEVVALEQAGERALGADLYVTLEPCPTTGRTGPCTERILAAGVRRVHAALLDPNPRVNGQGVARLREAGVEVVVGEAAAEARDLIRFYSTWVTTGRPYVTLKLATSLDGKVATAGGESRWITGRVARRAAHQLRSDHDSVMVGVGTVLADDPSLTARHRPDSRQPIRVVVDSHLRTPPSARVLTQTSGRTWIATLDQHPGPLEGAELIPLPAHEGRVSLEALLDELGRRQVTSLLVEGGPTVAGEVAARRLANRVVVFIAPLVLGGSQALSAIGGKGARTLSEAWRLRWARVDAVGSDLLLEAEV